QEALGWRGQREGRAHSREGVNGVGRGGPRRGLVGRDGVAQNMVKSLLCPSRGSSLQSGTEKQEIRDGPSQDGAAGECEKWSQPLPRLRSAPNTLILSWSPPADVTLDPDMAHPRLEDTHQHVPNNPKRFDSSRCILGLEGFSSGRHCWEVEVEDGESWAVGVARKSVRRKGRVTVNQEEGIWVGGQCGTQYLALTSPKIPLSLTEQPRTIGIYLDCEEGLVAFFDADNEAPIFTFPPASVPGEKILPLLCLGRASQFRLCPCITEYNVLTVNVIKIEQAACKQSE
uniref:B30.2/SPRY domain-containing protein n=1 Tax=Chelonoidis abingdonii TaxID=106734 RepID=A0A8C0GKB4_CHEAB